MEARQDRQQQHAMANAVRDITVLQEARARRRILVQVACGLLLDRVNPIIALNVCIQAQEAGTHRHAPLRSTRQ
jgi:hypothetical protein